MARIEPDRECINEKTYTDTPVDITQKQQEDIQNNVLSFNDPTLLMANIGTHNYLKTIHKQQEKKDIIKEGSKVTLLGESKSHKIDAWDWSIILNTIPYEIICSISKRVPRKYV